MRHLALAIVLAFHCTAPARSQDITEPPGIMVDVGGRRLHLNCSGEGSPTVVFEAAFGGSSLDWEKVQPIIARTTRACSYDRAGFGWSDAATSPRDSKSIAAELHRLLVSADIDGPYILVAHSLGGFHVRMFAAQFPAEVIGVALIDASHEDQFSWKSAVHWDVPMPVNLPPQKRAPDIVRSAPAQRLVDVMSRLPKWRAAIERENLAIGESVTQLRAAGSLPNVPLIVFSAGPERGFKEYWSERELRQHQMQAKLMALAPKSLQIRVPDSDHYIHLDRPNLVATAVADLVDVARKLEKR